jgi:hypothetical protein
VREIKGGGLNKIFSSEFEIDHLISHALHLDILLDKLTMKGF